MAQLQIPNTIRRILLISLILIFISTFITIIMGNSLSKVNSDIKALNKFLDLAKESQPNFEKSLEMYTDKTEEIIKFLLKLRPEKEEEYIKFISNIETIGQSLNLNIDLKSTANSGNKEKTLDYNISFYSTLKTLKAFLIESENLPYFIKIDDLNYKNPKLLTTDELEKNEPNIKIKIKLYIK